MLKIWITGIVGTLGSALAKNLSEEHEIKGNDIINKEDAWKIENMDEIKYFWKSSTDLDKEDLEEIELIIDCGLANANRPFGISSPMHTLLGNLLPPLRILEIVRKMKKKPVCIYPSSFNIFYGLKPQMLKESTPPFTSSVYGWTKACTEHLYQTYYKAYDVPVIITRVGSAFSSKGRSDELPHKLIIHCLKNKEFYLRSPEAKRLWCYGEDVIDFYRKLVENGPENFVGEILHCASNKGDEIVTNLELAERVKKITGIDIKITKGEYEPGEKVNGKPIDFTVDSTYTKVRLKWEPKHTLDEGLAKTIEWFKENLWRYK